MLLLEQLRKRRFYESGGRTDKRNDPHPEYGSRTADGNGGGNTGKVACTHTGGYTNGESLE